MKTGNQDKIGAAWDKTKGKVNEVVGEMTGDKSQELKGKAQGLKGEIRDKIADVKRGDREY